MEDTERIIFKLRDGRQLGVALFGDPNGFPIFYFHGFPGSRLEGKLLAHGLGENKQLKLIALDRPGIGLSTRKYHRSLKDWSDDVLEVANTLKMKKFGIIGVSGGGPFALACSKYIDRHRIIFVFVISSMVPPSTGFVYMHPLLRVGLKLTKFTKYPVYLILILIKQLFNNPKFVDKVMYSYINSLQHADKQLFVSTPNLDRLFVEETIEAFANDIWGMVQDVEIYAKPWKFDLSDLGGSYPLYILHGTKDDVIPLPEAKHLMNSIPNAHSIIYKGEGHFSTVDRLRDHLDQIRHLIETG